MNEDHELQAEGKVGKAKGAAHKAPADVKDAVKNATEGTVDKAEGGAHKAPADVKDAVKKATG